MKKFFLLILTFAYLASSSGATIYIHQCMGKTIEWDLSGDEKNNCAKCGMHKNAANDCCQDHVKVIKTHFDQNLPSGYLNNIFSPFSLPVPYHFFNATSLLTARNKNIEKFTHLRSSKISYCILYCTFLI